MSAVGPRPTISHYGSVARRHAAPVTVADRELVRAIFELWETGLTSEEIATLINARPACGPNGTAVLDTGR